MSRHLSRRRTARLLPTAAAGLVLALAACGSQDDGSEAASEPAATQSPSASAGDASLALTVDGSAAAGRCAMPSAEVLATFDTAFEGTVTSVEDGTVTLAVDQWYAGQEAETVTVAAPSRLMRDLLMAVDFQEGRTYLVSADDDRVTLCGFTAETTPALETLYAEAFVG